MTWPKARQTGADHYRALTIVTPITANLSPGGLQEQALRLDSWMTQMKDVISDRPLNQIVMPGSHDAGTWKTTSQSKVCPYGWMADISHRFPEVSATMARTQRVSLLKQLQSGARYFDLRICKLPEANGSWYTFHGRPLWQSLLRRGRRADARFRQNSPRRDHHHQT